MRRSFTIACLLLAWFCANGRVLDLVQCFAWARMFTEYAPRMPLTEAIAQTLDPNKPCPICVVVSKARGQQEASPSPEISAYEKLVLASTDVGVLLLRPVLEDWPAIAIAELRRRTDPVPVPPPRDIA